MLWYVCSRCCQIRTTPIADDPYYERYLQQYSDCCHSFFEMSSQYYGECLLLKLWNQRNENIVHTVHHCGCRQHWFGCYHHGLVRKNLSIFAVLKLKDQKHLILVTVLHPMSMEVQYTTMTTMTLCTETCRAIAHNRGV